MFIKFHSKEVATVCLFLCSFGITIFSQNEIHWCLRDSIMIWHIFDKKLGMPQHHFVVIFCNLSILNILRLILMWLSMPHQEVCHIRCKICHIKTQSLPHHVFTNGVKCVEYSLLKCLCTQVIKYLSG